MNEEQGNFQGDLLALVPQLRAYALLFCNQQDRADDLVQETLLRALEYQDSLRDRVAMKSWLFTAMRNVFFNGTRRLKYEVADENGVHAGALIESPCQERTVEVKDTLKALGGLEPVLREVMILVFVHDMSYEEVSLICNCAVGTVKSRINRGRRLLSKSLNQQPWQKTGRPKRVMIPSKKLCGIAPHKKTTPVQEPLHTESMREFEPGMSFAK